MVLDRKTMKTAERPGIYNELEFATSISHESRLKTDPYILWWTPQGLYSPNHKRFVKSVVEEFDPGLKKPDSRAYLKLEEKVAKNDSGTIFWFSPAASPRESHKIIATEIYTARNGAKITFNYAVLFLRSQLSREQFAEAANKMAEYAKEERIENPTERRRKPIFIKGTTVHWTHFTDIVLPNEEWGRIRTKEVWKTKAETLKDAQNGEEVYGNYDLSCPLAFDTMFNLGKDKVNCPNCKKVVYVKVGERCEGCKQVRPC